MRKKDLKKAVNEYGAFLQIPIDVMERNAVGDDLIASVPENTFVFKGIASNGALNDNGYIIREDAWKNAIPEYMKNPIVLFQHNDDKGIGNTVKAEMTENGLEVTGYIYKDLDALHTGGAIAKGVYRSLSTGHITKDFEFQNTKTNDVMTKEDFKTMIDKQGWGEWMNDWVRAVTALRFAEWSIVAVPSNAAALRTNNTEREFLSRFFEIEDNSLTDDVEVTPESEPEKTGETPVAEAPAKTEEPKASEIPVPVVHETNAVVPVVTPAEAKAELVITDAVKSDPIPSEVNYADLMTKQNDQLTTQITAIANAVLLATQENAALRKELSALKSVVDNIPAKKGLIVSSQWKRVEEKVKDAGVEELKAAFARADVKLKE